MDSFYFDTTLITISVIVLTSITGVLTFKLISLLMIKSLRGFIFMKVYFINYIYD